MRGSLAGWMAVGFLLPLPGTAMADAAGPTFGSPAAFTESGGAAVYGAACAGCHQADGRGAVGAGAYPSLAGDARLAAPAYPVTVVLRGRNAMPGFGRLLTDEQVAAVVGFIRDGFGNGYADGPSAGDVAALR